MMAVGDATHGRQHFYSTPDKQIFGHSMGTSNDNFNVLTFKENACEIANYRNDEFEPFDVHINGGNLLLYQGRVITLTASGQGGTPPYSYSWYTSTDGFNYNYLGGGTTFSFTLNNPITFVRLRGVDALLNVDNEHRTFRVPNINFNSVATQNESALPKFTGVTNVSTVSGSVPTIFPNPANQDVSVNLPNTWTHDRDGEMIEIKDVTGRTISKINIRENIETYTFSLLNISKGMYFVTIGNTAKFTLKFNIL